MNTLTATQRKALDWLRARGGDAVFTRHGVALAQGDLAPFERKTWNALRDARLIEFYGGVTDGGTGYGRLRISGNAGGVPKVQERPAKPDPNNDWFGRGGRRVDDLPGAE